MVTYPKQLDAGSEAEAAAIELLSPLMERLRVSYLVERHRERWHAVRPWETILSTGEQQSLGIVRLLYSKPSFAILDEATAAMPEDMRREVYALLQERQVAYVTVSGDALAQFHRQHLRLGEESGPVLEKVEPMVRSATSAEKRRELAAAKAELARLRAEQQGSSSTDVSTDASSGDDVSPPHTPVAQGK